MTHPSQLARSLAPFPSQTRTSTWYAHSDHQVPGNDAKNRPLSRVKCNCPWFLQAVWHQRSSLPALIKVNIAPAFVNTSTILTNLTILCGTIECSQTGWTWKSDTEMVLVPVSVQYKWKCTLVTSKVVTMTIIWMVDGVNYQWDRLRRRREWEDYPVDCKAICSDNTLLNHYGPEHHENDCRVMVSWCHGGSWWSEQTSALQQGILSRSSPPSHQT